jgi:glutamate/tyrosine decarboxylase-like PLP-dependent enzyme
MDRTELDTGTPGTAAPARTPREEQTLDPADWEALRALGHRMVDDMLDHLRTVRDRPVWQPVPAAVKERLRAPAPVDPQDAGRIYEEFKRDVLPYGLGNIHPRFWAWVIGSGTPLGALAEMLAATMNPNVGGADQGANYVELQVLDWLKEMLGYPPGSSGLLVSGGSMANLVGLTVARNRHAPVDLAQAGLQAVPRRMVLYASTETHNSVRNAVSVLGLGRDALREIPVRPDFTVDVAALAAAIATDRAAGHLPFCVVANAGTVNTGAIDDLVAIADLCREHGLWLHVDGAFGAFAAAAPRLRPLVAGMERADSLAFDLHKWLHVPYEAGCTLVRDAEAHRAAFVTPADYLHRSERGVAAGPIWFSEYGMQLSRGFRALKVWTNLKEVGTRRHGELIEQNCDQARELGRLVAGEPELELMAPIPLNIVCFRWRRAGLSEPELDAANERILVEIQESGFAILTSTRLHGRLAMRVSITNHRTRREDLSALVRTVLEHARR